MYEKELASLGTVVAFLTNRFKRDHQIKQTLQTARISIEGTLRLYTGKEKDEIRSAPTSRKSSQVQADLYFKQKTAGLEANGEAVADGKLCQEDDLCLSLESLSNDYWRIASLVEYYFYLLQEDFCEPSSILETLKKKVLSTLHNRSVELTSKARKELCLIEQQLGYYFQNLDSDLTVVFATLNKFYDHP